MPKFKFPKLHVYPRGEAYACRVINIDGQIDIADKEQTVRALRDFVASKSVQPWPRGVTAVIVTMAMTVQKSMSTNKG